MKRMKKKTGVLWVKQNSSYVLVQLPFLLARVKILQMIIVFVKTEKHTEDNITILFILWIEMGWNG